MNKLYRLVGFLFALLLVGCGSNHRVTPVVSQEDLVKELLFPIQETYCEIDQKPVRISFTRQKTYHDLDYEPCVFENRFTGNFVESGEDVPPDSENAGSKPVGLWNDQEQVCMVVWE